MSKTVPAPEFEANCLALLDEVAAKHEEVVVLKDGRPHAKVVPITRRFRTLEELRHSGRVVGDLLEPLDEEWDVEK